MLVNKEAMRAWVDALRSGEFQQGQKRLYNADEDSYCCLGVLCVVAKREGAIEHLPWEHPDDIVRNNDCLTRDVMTWIFGEDTPEHDDDCVGDIIIAQGVPRKCEICNEPHSEFKGISAVEANDTLNWTFAQIADAVEKRFLAKEPASK